MRRYETFVILDPDLSEDERAPVMDRIQETIKQQDGFAVSVDDWGARKLAYEIKKKTRGYYVRLDYCGGGSLVNELERFFRIDDRVLKYMTVLLEPQADLERIKEEVAQAKAQEAEKVQPQTEAKAESGESKAADDETPAAEPPDESEAEAAKTETAPVDPETEPVEATKEG